MSLRTRLAISVGLLVATAIAVTGWVLHRATEQELVDEVDAFLIERAERLAPFDLIANRGRGFGALEGRGGQGLGVGRFSEDDAIAQIVTVDGTVISLTETQLPVLSADLEIAAGRRGATLREAVVDGVEYRLITQPLRPGQAAVMVGRDLSEVNAAVTDVAQRALLLGAIGTALAALATWVMASRLSAPVNKLMMAAEHVAATQDLTASIEVRGDAEVGRLAASFNTMLGALQMSRKQQQRLVMDASHELRTPLTSLRTNVDLLRRAKSMSGADRDEIMDDVSRELDELSALVAELVELSTSSRRPDEPVGPLDLGLIAANVAQRAERRFGRTLNVTTTGPIELYGHGSLVERALWNLVDNAVKFSEAGTEIDLGVDGGRVQVRDRGPGISQADRELVFDRFYRAVETRSEPGSGLGLSIVADIVATHNGATFVDEPHDGLGVIVGFEINGIAGPEWPLAAGDP